MAFGDGSAPTGAGAELETKVFVSYSRKDIGFVDRLDQALRARGIQVLIDRTEIFSFEDWWERIQSLIAQAHSVVFVISPDSVQSDVCRREIAIAEQQHKRLAPIVATRVSDDAVPQQLSRLNYIFFDDPAGFSNSVDRLIEALSTDIQWIRKHAEFGELALRWAAAGRPGPRGLLLRPPELEDAERWLALRPPSAPSPTEAQIDFILESRKAEQERVRRERLRSRIVIVVSLAVAAIVSVLAWNFFKSSQEALKLQSLSLADASHRQLLDSDPVTAQLLALEGLPDSAATDMTQRLRPYQPPTGVALDSSLREWQSANWQERRTFGGHTASVIRASFSPDGRIFATGSSDKTIRLWDPANTNELRILRGHEDAVTSLAFSPDGRTLVSAGRDKTVRLWDVANGTEIAVLRGHEKSVGRVVFSPDGKLIASSSEDGTARLWDAASGREVFVLRGHINQLWAVLFSPDGQTVATISQDQTVRLWSVATGETLHVMPTSDMRSVTFSPNGKILATAGMDGNARLWDVATGEQLKVLAGHTNVVWQVDFSSDGLRLLTASDDRTARLWDVATGRVIAIMADHENGVRIARFSPDGNYIATATSGTVVRLWDASNATLKHVLRGHEVWVRNLAFAPDSKALLTVDDDGSTRIWEFEPKQPPILFGEGASNAWTNASLSPDGKLVSITSDKTARILNFETRQEIAVLRGHEDSIYLSGFSADSRLLATRSADNTIRVWEAGSGNLICVIRLPVTRSFSWRFSPDAKLIATTDDSKVVQLWNTSDGSRLAALQGHEARVSFTDFSPKSDLIATASEDGTIRSWSLPAGNPIRVLGKIAASIKGIKFTPDASALIAFSNDGKLRFLDIATGAERRALQIDKSDRYVLSPNQQLIATASAGLPMRMWDVATGTMLYSDSSNTGQTVFSADSRLVGISGGYNHALCILEAVSGAELAVLTAAPGIDLNTPRFSPDDQTVLTSTYNGSVRLWSLPPSPQAVIDSSKSTIIRCLTPTQRRIFRLSDGAPRWCYDLHAWPYTTAEAPNYSFGEFFISALNRLARWTGKL